MSEATSTIDRPKAPARLSPSAAKVRIYCAVLVLIFGPMLAIGMWLTPSPTGVETHRQLGLPPCGFYTLTGRPCPTCGYTTAVTLVVHGRFWDAIVTQPGGAAVGFIGIAAVVLGIMGLVTGRWFGPDPFKMAWHSGKIIWIGLAFFLLSWVYKIVIMTSWFHPHA